MFNGLRGTQGGHQKCVKGTGSVNFVVTRMDIIEGFNKFLDVAKPGEV